MLQRKDHENYQNLPEEQKRQYARERYRKFFIETEFNEEEKTKMINMHAIYVKIRKEEKTKGANICLNNIEIF